MNVDGRPFRTVWAEGSTVCLIDQPRLPHRFGVHRCQDHLATAAAIRTMVVRGAGAIGATAGHGLAQAALEAPDENFHDYVARAARTLEATRPTAQNLFYAVARVLAAIEAEGDHPTKARQAAVAAAHAIADEDAAACRAIGQVGRPLLGTGARVSTHCNAGWLAFVDWGSALSPIYAAHRDGAEVFVWVDETRPRSQGARLTAWELAGEGIPHAVVADNATGLLLQTCQIDCVIVGADRIAANGDVANKIGTYTSALAARAAGVPFYVAAPLTTVDATCPSGAHIPIEERHSDEVAWVWGWTTDGRFDRVRVVPEGTTCHNPAFDVTPAALVTGIITPRGVVTATQDGLASVLGG